MHIYRTDRLKIMEIKTENLDNGNLILNTEYAELLKGNGISSADKLWTLTSEPVKKLLKERGTEKAFLENNGEKIEVYIKHYTPPPLKERIKAASSLKFKSFDAFDEWDSLLAFHRHNLPTMIPLAVARQGAKTCILTLGITDYRRASHLFEEFTAKDNKRKEKLILKIADLAGKMHSEGMAHQDFYLVHIFVKENNNDEIFLIDLQRTIKQNQLSERWRIKDLAQIYFSAEPFINTKDTVLFWQRYTKICNPELYKNQELTAKILKKALKIKKHTEKKYKINAK
jgi:heptose I phosphotransferase